MLGTPGARSFEALFGIPPQHQLVLVRSRSKRGLISGTTWEHEQYDTAGQLVARFESFEETGPTGQQVSGWRQFSPQGELIVEEHLISADARLGTDVRPPFPHLDRQAP